MSFRRFLRRFLANLVAVFGEYDISGEVESKRSISKNVKRVIVHRQYDAATFENDIALLELESPVSYDQHIVPICMPDDEDDFTGRMAVVTGWGRLKYGERARSFVCGGALGCHATHQKKPQKKYNILLINCIILVFIFKLIVNL